MDNYIDQIEKRKEEISKGIDDAMKIGEAPEDVLLAMKDILTHLRPITSMEEYSDLD